MKSYQLIIVPRKGDILSEVAVKEKWTRYHTDDVEDIWELDFSKKRVCTMVDLTHKIVSICYYGFIFIYIYLFLEYI